MTTPTIFENFIPYKTVKIKIYTDKMDYQIRGKNGAKMFAQKVKKKYLAKLAQNMRKENQVEIRQIEIL